ncbi:MAG: hypothetical protein LBL18_06190, partial [Bacteroidales bacterium]|nr:hypothetical protein [Bacteroidales bacterium]
NEVKSLYDSWNAIEDALVKYGENFRTSYYGSSTEYDDYSYESRYYYYYNYHYYFNFNDGSIDITLKYNNYSYINYSYIRAIYKF